MTTPTTRPAALTGANVCTSCLHRLSRQSRHYAAAAAAFAATSETTQQEAPVRPVTQTGPRKAFRLSASPVISRPPLLTRELTSFEKAYFLYQKRLNERLALPFTRYFYYKKGTPTDEERKRKQEARTTAARDIGMYSGYGETAWNDEVLVGDKTGEPENQVKALIMDAEGKEVMDAKPVGDSEADEQKISGNEKEGEGTGKTIGQSIAIERPAPRRTQADEENDVRSLNRKLDRSLYFVVKGKDGHWRFPEDLVYGRENLQQAAERIIIQSCGINMNTWMVGNHPIGHYMHAFARPRTNKVLPNPLVSTSTGEFEQEEYGEKVFFMKCRIMAGQADFAKNEYGDQDYQWAAMEEIEGLVRNGYWSQVRNMLTER